MAANSAESIAMDLLARAGITANGDKSCDIRIHQPRFFERILKGGVLAFGESYMDGWWDSPELDQCIERLLRAWLAKKIEYKINLWSQVIKARLFNLQKPTRSCIVGRRHYDIGNDLYQAMLDPHMQYTCAYWKNARTLAEAQINKLELICKKLGLRPGMRILDLGCGFSGFARYAALEKGCRVTGVTVSKNQVEWGRAMCKGLPVDIRLDDYRNVEGTYDRVISIGIMEHVGYKNYGTYMDVVDRTLADDGLAFIHTIGTHHNRPITNAWTAKYIFPNGMVPSIAQLARAMDKKFVMEDWHNFGPDYDKTLMAWFANFERAWPRLKTRYDERFYRMWKFYLLSSAASFRSRALQLWQIVITRAGRSQPCCRFD